MKSLVLKVGYLIPRGPIAVSVYILQNFRCSKTNIRVFFFVQKLSLKVLYVIHTRYQQTPEG